MTDILTWFTEPLSHGFMSRALVATLISASVCALLSCWLVQIGWSLMGDAVSHAVFPGVVFAHMIGVPFALGAFIFGAGAVGLIGALQSRTTLKSDTTIGVVFTSLFALGIAVNSVFPSQVDLNHILFGNILGVGVNDLLLVAIVGFASGAVLLLKRRDLTLYAFDPVQAHTLGIRVRGLRILLLLILALVVVITLQTVGIILVVAMLIIPGATALLVSGRMSRILPIAVASALLSSMVGVYAAYYLNASVGGVVVLTQAALFMLALILGPRGGLLPNMLRSRRAAQTSRAPESGVLVGVN